MIHTMQLTFQPTAELYYDFIDKCVPRTKSDPTKPRVYEQWIKKGTPHGGYKYVSDVWKDNGITGITDNAAYRFVMTDPVTQAEMDTGYWFEVRINLPKLINPDEHVDVYQAPDWKQMIKAFNDAMDLLGIGMPHFEYWNAKRVDYCFNAITPYVQLYTGKRNKTGKRKQPFSPLLHKGKHPYHTQPKNYKRDKHGNKVFYETVIGADGREHKHYFDERAKNKHKNPGSFFLRYQGYRINFYDKQDEIEQSMIEAKTVGDMEKYEALQQACEKAENILRLEVQCFDTKLNTIKNRYRSKSRAASLFLHPAIAQQVLSDAIKEVTESGRYYRADMADDIIKKSRCQKTTKQDLSKILEAVRSPHRNISIVEDVFADLKDFVMDKDTYKSRLKTLAKIGVNPVTIPKNAIRKKDMMDDGLPCVMDLFTAAVSQERTEDLEEYETWLKRALELKETHDHEMKWHRKSLVDNDELELEIDSEYDTEAD